MTGIMTVYTKHGETIGDARHGVRREVALYTSRSRAGIVGWRADADAPEEYFVGGRAADDDAVREMVAS